MERIGISLWVSFFICFFCNVFAGLISTLMPSYLPQVVKELANPDDITRVSSMIVSLYLAGWTIGGFTWGYISDKIGRAKALALSVGSFGLLTLLLSFATSWEWVVFVRLLSGFAVGGILVITPTLLSEIWPAKSRSVMLGIDSIGFPVGIFSTGIVRYMVSDWREGFYIGALPLLLGVLSFFFLIESINWKTAKTSDNTIVDPQSTSNLVKGSIIFGSMLIGLWGMFSWIPSWMDEVKGEVGIAMMLLGAGGVTGGIISGWISNALGVGKAMLICFSGCFVMSFLLFGMNTSFSNIIYAELTLLSLFFGISQGLLSIYIPQLFPYHVRGTYTGICFNVGRIVTTLAVFSVGAIVHFAGGIGHALLWAAGIFIIGFIAVYFTKDQQKITT